MNTLTIETFLTTEISEDLWCSYLNNFNRVFDKEFSLDHFQNKYISSFGTSYHSFLIDNMRNVVGAVSVIPMKYYINSKPILVGLIVDLFVVADFRKDPLVMLKLYVELKRRIKDHLGLLVAVPNINSVGYFLNILKFQKIGSLEYRILPLNAGNIKFQRNKILNAGSQVFARVNIFINTLFASVIRVSNIDYKIRLDLNEDFMKYRFQGPYKIYDEKHCRCYYRVVNEDGVITAYIIYFAFKDKLAYKSFLKAIKHIVKKENVDLVLHVGSMGFYQTVMMKVPNYWEPKKLPLIYDNIKLDSNDLEVVNNMKYWDFGLINYDVR